eukprot:m.476187 g.476187  ORF g.476187 m.476187 type:complete len:400 (+) comp40234_c0_seq1:65-1264(+)
MSTPDAAVAAYWRADQIRTRMAQLSSDEQDALARIEAATEELKRLKSEMRALATEWNDIVNRPLPDNVDPTLWLPDEIMVMILCLVECIGHCCLVCRRWRALCNDPAVRRHERAARWYAYARRAAVEVMLNNSGAGTFRSPPQADFAAKTLNPVMSFSNLSAAKVTRLAAEKDVLVALSPAEIKFVWKREIGFQTLSVIDKLSLFQTVAIILGGDTDAYGNEYDVICCSRAAEVFVWARSYHHRRDYRRFKTLSGESVKAIASAKNRRHEIAVLTGDTVEVWTDLTSDQPSCLRRLAPEKHVYPIPTAVCMWTDGTIFTACKTHIHVYLYFPGALGPDSRLPDYTLGSEHPVFSLAVSDRTCSLYGIWEDAYARKESHRSSDVVVTWGVISRGWRPVIF